MGRERPPDKPARRRGRTPELPRIANTAAALAVAAAAAVAAALVVVPSARAEPDRAALEDALFRLVQASRDRAGAPALVREAALDRLARDEARALAARPHRERLDRMDAPLGDLLRDAGIRGYRSAFLHRDLQRGYAQPAEQFHASWRGYAPAWTQAMDPETDTLGLGIARGDDGWLVLVAVALVARQETIDPDDVERRAAAAIDDVRARHGLGALRRVAELDRLARAHSRDMAARGYFAHRSPEGVDVAGRARVAGIAWSEIGENIYYAQGVADVAGSAVDGWMDSPGHRKNILRAAFVETGMGAFVTEDRRVYLTQVFRAPPDGRR